MRKRNEKEEANCVLTYSYKLFTLFVLAAAAAAFVLSVG
jgi:hypothetical protein